MTVITISRDFGSSGNYIAEKTAQVLGYHFVDKEFFESVLSEYGLVEFDREYDVRLGFWEKFDPKLFNRRDEAVYMLAQVIRAVAQHGNVVILGRSGFEILGKFAGMVHVRLQAPLSLRIKRVMAEMKIPLDQAEAIVKENDKAHVAFVQEYYELPWDAAHAFDLVINTGKISPDLATDWLVETVTALGVDLDLGKPSISSLEIDHVLENAINEALKCNIAHK